MVQDPIPKISEQRLSALAQIPLSQVPSPAYVMHLDLLEENGITVNKNGVPNDPRSFVETSGIRIGTAAETTRGHDEAWFEGLAGKIVTLLS